MEGGTLFSGVKTIFGVATGADAAGTFLAPTFFTRRENFSWSNHEGDVVIVLFGTEQAQLGFEFRGQLIEDNRDGRGSVSAQKAQRHSLHAGVNHRGIARQNGLANQFRGEN